MLELLAPGSGNEGEEKACGEEKKLSSIWLKDKRRAEVAVVLWQVTCSVLFLQNAFPLRSHS